MAARRPRSLRLADSCRQPNLATNMTKIYKDIATIERRIAELSAAQVRDSGLRRYVVIQARTIEPLAFDSDGNGGHVIRAVHLEHAARFPTSTQAHQMSKRARGFADGDGGKVCPLADLYGTFLRCLNAQLEAARNAPRATAPHEGLTHKGTVASQRRLFEKD
jgi:hypothetical protein